jgi:hypothetical protein
MWRRFLQGLGRGTLVVFVGGAGAFYYVALKDRTPGPQDPFDPAKKNLVVLGTGWGATSLLKSIDTNDYNVVSSLVVCARGVVLSGGRADCRQPEQLLPLHAAPA